MELWVPFAGAGGILATIFVVIVGGGWFISTWNKLIYSEGRVDVAWKNINVQLKKRHDLLPDIIATTKGAAKHEREFFDKLFEARLASAGASKSGDILGTASAEKSFSSMIPRINALSEAYPEMKSNPTFMQLSSRLNSIEEEIASYRLQYNEAAGSHNILIRLIPTVFFAKLIGSKSREFFDIFPEEREDIKVEF